MAGRSASDSTDVGPVDLPATARQESAEDALLEFALKRAMLQSEWSKETKVMSRSVSYGRNDANGANVVDSALRYDYRRGLSE